MSSIDYLIRMRTGASCRTILVTIDPNVDLMNGALNSAILDSFFYVFVFHDLLPWQIAASVAPVPIRHTTAVRLIGVPHYFLALHSQEQAVTY